MHPCLQIPDIQFLIISEFFAENDRRSCAVMARTCKVFYEPAMDALWRKLDGLGPLVHCMPSELFCEEVIPAPWPQRYEDFQCTFSREPTRREWDTAFKHAHRVRDFTFALGYPPHTNKAMIYSAEVLSGTLHHMNDRVASPDAGPIFPNLLMLRCRWYHGLKGIWGCIPRLFGPSLHTLKIYGNTANITSEIEPLNLLLRSFKEAYPAVENLQVVSDSGIRDHFGSSSSELSEYILRLPRLRTFYSNVMVSEPAVSKLLTMHHLTAITLSLPPSLNNLKKPDIMLDSLQRLDITASSIDCITTFLNLVEAPMLRDLNMQATSAPNITSVERLFAAAASHRKLQLIRIWADRFMLKGVVPCMVTGRTLSLLYPLSQLRDVLIEEHIHVDLTDDDALALAKAWPRLRSLTFMTIPGPLQYQPSPFQPHLTLRGLHHLARHCQSLRRLGIALDASRIETDIMRPLKENEQCHSLALLEVHAPLSRVERPGEVAYMLHRLFPKMHTVSFAETDVSLYRGWYSVWRTFKALAAGPL